MARKQKSTPSKGRMLDEITAYMGGAVQSPTEGYGSTEPKKKGFTSGDQLFPADGRAMEYRNDQMRTNNEIRVNGAMIYKNMNFFGWSD